MSDIKLLSCPICGREVYIGTEDYDDNIEDVIVCDHCNLRFYGSYPATKQDLAEEWNTRKPMERIKAIFKERAEKYLGEAKMQKHNRFYNIAGKYESRAYSYLEAMEVVDEECGISE